MAKSKKVITKTIDEQIQEKASYIVTIHDIKKDDEFKKTAAQINKILAIDAKNLQQKYNLFLNNKSRYIKPGFYKFGSNKFSDNHSILFNKIINIHNFYFILAFLSYSKFIYFKTSIKSYSNSFN